MMWHTHAALGASAVWMLLPFVPRGDSGVIALLMVCAVTGALTPDLDAAESKMKHLRIAGIKPFAPIAMVVHRDFGHRGLWHSLWAWVTWTLLLLPLIPAVGWLPVAAFSLGYASHLVGDAATIRGIPFCYPNLARRHLLPRPLRMVTGSEEEEVVFIVFALLVMGLLLRHLRLVP